MFMPTDEMIEAMKIGAHCILDHYQQYDGEQGSHATREHVRWALNFVGNERSREEVADISLWLQQ